MSLMSIMARRRFRPTSRVFTEPPGPWPVDPELTRRVAEERKRIERTRRQLALHVLPARRREERPRGGRTAR